jgi:beta-lactam-binding protein with PASTA domain
MLGSRLSIGNIDRRRAAGPPGFVIDQSPRPGSQVYCGSAVNVLIAEQERPCQVPALVDARVDGPASGILESRRLRLGRIDRRPDPRPKGTIIDQSPEAGSYVPCGSAVNVLVAVPDTPPPCRVPDLFEAGVGPAKDILGRQRLTLGRVDTRTDSRPRGTIIDQSPERGTSVPCGSPVNVLVAVPLPPDVPPTCRVPRLVGADARTIRNLLSDARLSLGSTSSRQDARPAGTVIEQRPFADALVSCGSPVDVIVADDPECKVPSLVGRDEKQAIELISGAQLRVGSVRRQESDQAGGTILTQSFGPGTIVKCDTAIDVVVAQRVTRVPSLSGNDVPAAGRRLTQSGLRLGKTLERESTAAPGTVVDQMPAANTIVAPDSPVDVWVAVRKPVIVPNLQGQDRARAGQTLADVGLNLIELGKRESNEKAGSVVGQVPAANTSVKWGAAVGVWLAIPVPPPPVAWVPSLTGVAQNEALGLIGNAKLTPGAISQRESSQTPGTVLDQRPAAGTQVQLGTAVDFTLAIPVRKSIVPDLVGQRQTGAEALLGRNTLRIGGVISRASKEPAGVIVGQRPAAGRQVDPGSTVDVWVAAPLPPVTVTVPDLSGSSQNEATASIQNLKLRIGQFGERESREPRGTVVAQDPPAGTVVEAGSLVSVWLAVPIVPPPVTLVTVPRVVESSLDRAVSMLGEAGLRPGSVDQRPSVATTGTVTFQSVEAGVQVAQGTAINLAVAAPLAPWWSLIPPWLSTGALFVLVAAATATVKRVRRNRIISTPTLVPHVDAGTQFSVPGDRDLTNFEIALEARRDRGVQTLDCPDEFIAGYWSGKQEPSW